MLSNSEVLKLLDLPNELLEDLASKESSTFTPAKNQVIDAIINKIVYQTVDSFGFENPFKKFDGRRLEFGDTIENVFVETPKGYTFNKDATDPFTKFVTNVKVLYANINYERQYGATIEDAMFRRAVLNQYGLSDLIGNILKQLSTSKNLEEYQATLGMLNTPDLYGNSVVVDEGLETEHKEFEKLNIYGLDETQVAKAITSKIKDITTSFKQPSRNHNAFKVMNTSRPDGITLVIKRVIKNSIDLDFLTGVFNLDKVGINAKIIEVEDFRQYDDDGNVFGDDIAFAVIDDRCWDNHVALEDGGLIYNPKGKYTNHFMNLWKVMGFKYFYNAEAVVLDNTNPNAEPETPTEPAEETPTQGE